MIRISEVKSLERILPRTRYDIKKYANYIDWLNGKHRDHEADCHCFALFTPQLIELLEEYLKQHQNCECYKRSIKLSELKNL